MFRSQRLIEAKIRRTGQFCVDENGELGIPEAELFLDPIPILVVFSPIQAILHG